MIASIVLYQIVTWKLKIFTLVFDGVLGSIQTDIYFLVEVTAIANKQRILLFT